jgi:hypothetical protein
MYYLVQLKIKEIWQSFFFIGHDSLDESCQFYRELREVLREAGIPYPSRLIRSNHNDEDNILRHRDQYRAIARIINDFYNAKIVRGELRREESK